jgi:DsbC/DsbD-like thiol-disulfide interchange protein
MRSFALFALFLSLAGGGAAAPAETEWATTLKAKARLVDAGAKDGARWAAIEIVLDPGAVTYWRNPGEAGVSPQLDLSASRNLAKSELLFPAPGRFDKAGALTFGYHDRVMLPLRVAAADPGRPVELVATLDYGVCETICVPAHAALRLTLPPGRATTAHSAALAATLALTPRPTLLGAAGAPSILAVAAEPGATPPAWRVATRGPGAQLFVEAPEGWWFDVEPAGGEAFRLVLAQKPKGAGPDPELRLTLAAPDRAVETTLRLDRAGAAP